MYYLTRGGGAKPPARPDPARKRPELLLLGPGDRIELGSAIRSACAFGWGRLFVQDRERQWFTDDRITRSEGRGAARRGRNSIRVIPTAADQSYGFGEVCVVTARCSGNRTTPLHRANLANGHQQIIVIPDECRIDVAAEDWERLGGVVKFVHLDVPNPALARRYRLTASIVLAEVARQVGRKVRRDHVERPGLRYESALDLLLEIEVEEISLEELAAY